MLGAAGVVFAGAVALLALSWVRRRRKGLPILGEREDANTGLVVLFGVVVPVLVLAALFAVANLSVANSTEAPAGGTTRMTISVIGHQWFWEVRYPGSAAVTANEIHIPVRTRVNLVARTADVIHSFWVPQLNRKIDMIPGRSNRILLYADKPGRYRGQCAEFCGLQHAHMGMYVFADEPARFRAWLARAGRPAAAPSSPQARQGEQTFVSSQCADCHTIRGTSAQGRIGPDLTHLAGRTTLAALTLANRRTLLADWIRDPQHYKPGVKMPALDLTSAQRQAIVAYLETLR
jgi:cytochrome c oxidase subunit 2